MIHRAAGLSPAPSARRLSAASTRIDTREEAFSQGLVTQREAPLRGYRMRESNRRSSTLSDDAAGLQL